MNPRLREETSCFENRRSWRSAACIHRSRTVADFFAPSLLSFFAAAREALMNHPFSRLSYNESMFERGIVIPREKARLRVTLAVENRRSFLSFSGAPLREERHSPRIHGCARATRTLKFAKRARETTLRCLRSLTVNFFRPGIRRSAPSIRASKRIPSTFFFTLCSLFDVLLFTEFTEWRLKRSRRSNELF